MHVDAHRDFWKSPGFITFSLSFSMILTLGGCFYSPKVSENLEARVVEGNLFDTTPVRGEFKPLRNRRTGFEYRCTECHEDFDSPPTQGNLEGEHKEIHDMFAHGLNTSCMNCHNNADRDSYIDHDGTAIPATNPARLCAKCHGPTYRDWERGIHGRQNGYWDRTRGERTKLLCVQCHNPHAPKFAPMAPDAPPPYSRLSATVPSHDTHSEEKHEPAEEEAAH